MTTEEIQSISDEELSEEIGFRESFSMVLTPLGESVLIELKAEAARRSALFASQRAARGEQALPLDTV